MLKLFLFFIMVTISSSTFAAPKETRIIRTYMSFGLPIDPANIKTLVDLDISYALSATLVEWSDERNLIEGLAKLPVEENNVVKVELRPTSKWSDGSPITAAQVVRNFDRIKKQNPPEAKSLFEVVESITATSDSTVTFKLKAEKENSRLLHKLTEPMYGIVFVRDDGSIDLTKTSGSFFLTEQTLQELSFKANPYWYGKTTDMAEEIVIRQPKTTPNASEQEIVSADQWPNILSTSSLVPQGSEAVYAKNNFKVWNRSLDRVFFLTPSKRLANADGRSLVKFLNKKLSRETLVEGLTGFHFTNQFFPSGYSIFDKSFKINLDNAILPQNLKNKKLEVLAADGRLGPILKANFTKAIKEITGVEPKIRLVPLANFAKERELGHYDLFLATLPINDPNIEGAVSFFFSFDPPLIPNSGPGDGNLSGRVANARTLSPEKRNDEFRNVFTKAVQDGSLLPLFHFSSVALARDGIDLSRVPTTDETVSFSKVSFK